MFDTSQHLDSIVLPDKVVENIGTYFGEDGLKWVADFKQHLERVTREWEVNLQKPFSNLSVNFVAPVTLRNGDQAVLKMGFPHKDLATECHALCHFAGQGAVKLLRCEPSEGTMLLEYLKPGRPLKELDDDDEATRIAAQAMKLIWKPVRDESLYPSVKDWFQGFKKLRQRFDGDSGPFDSGMIALAENVSTELLGGMGEQVVLHGDLHHDNIVSSNSHGWVVIDPKGVVGEREYEVGALLRNPSPEIYTKQFERRVEILAEELGFDRQKITQWAFTQAVLSAVWSVDGPVDNWKSCMDWAKEISPFID